MARIARVICPGVPHHITQRGNRRQKTFWEQEDYLTYLELMGEWCEKCDVAILAYVLMPNHVQLIAVPSAEESLARAVGEAHRRYTRYINTKKKWRGYLWQGRFASFPMDEAHTWSAARYIELNPVKARLARHPGQYRWSSARAHLRGEDDDLVTVAPLLGMVDNWKAFLAEGIEREAIRLLERHERTGRPLGDERFMRMAERITGRSLRPGKPGPKPRKPSHSSYRP